MVRKYRLVAGEMEQIAMGAAVMSATIWVPTSDYDALAAELATVKAELDSVKNCRDHQADMLNEYVAQVEHWKAEAVWAANEFMKERECFFQVSYMGQWEMEIAKDPDYQRAQAILKEEGDE